MSELIVIGYDSQDKAELARIELFNMSHEYLVGVDDAVVATVDAKGKIRLNQMVNLWATGATGGAFWGLLAGVLFFHPLLGVLVGSTAGALSGAMSDFGIDDNFMKDVSKVLQPGQAALFLLVRANASDKMIERLGIKGGHILRTNLDRSQEEHLKRAFHRAHSDLAKAHVAESAS